MVDKLSRSERSENMRRIRSKNMNPEMVVRRLVYHLGYRYRLHKATLPGSPDLVFSSKKKVIFVHGCFWHQHSSKKCPIVRKPKSNKAYWNLKLRNNVKRDKKNQKKLRGMRWEILNIWECETRDIEILTRRIKIFLK